MSNLKNKEMKHLSTILPHEVLNQYIEMYENKTNWTKEARERWIPIFGAWMAELLYEAIQGDEKNLELSLSRTNWRGKKTRALLVVLGVKEPKTLGELKKTFTQYYEQFR